MQAGIDKIVTSLDTASFTFPDIASGLAATVDGQYFRSALIDEENLFAYYRNQSGTAVLQGYLASDKYLKERLIDVDSPGNKYPIDIDDSGKVFTWIEDDYFNTGKGLHPDITPEIKTEGIVSTKYPLHVDSTGKVFDWVEDGYYNTGKGLHPDLVKGLITPSDIAKAILSTQVVSSGSSLWLGKSKISRLQSGLSSKLKIGFTGDSWTEHKEIPQAFADYLYPKLGKAGEGWIQLNIDNVNLINNVSLVRNGWSVYDASTTSANPPYPTSMDGQYIYATGTAATLTLSNIYATSIRIFYYDGDGTFRYSINGASSVAVVGTGTNKIISVTVSGLNVATSSALVIDQVGNAGTTVLYGFYAEGSGNGVEINKMGNGGITAPGYTKTLPYLTQTASVVSPDILFIIIGTNDYRTSVALDSFKTNLTALTQAWQAVVPDAAIVLVTPPQCNASGANPLSSFRDAMRDVSASLGVEFYSMYDFMNTTWAKSNALGMWFDSLHLSSAGARFMFNDINKKFLGV